MSTRMECICQIKVDVDSLPRYEHWTVHIVGVGSHLLTSAMFIQCFAHGGLLLDPSRSLFSHPPRNQIHKQASSFLVISFAAHKQAPNPLGVAARNGRHFPVPSSSVTIHPNSQQSFCCRSLVKSPNTPWLRRIPCAATWHNLSWPVRSLL